jgi:hypothetical protein
MSRSGKAEQNRPYLQDTIQNTEVSKRCDVLEDRHGERPRDARPLHAFTEVSTLEAVCEEKRTDLELSGEAKHSKRQSK